MKHNASIVESFKQDGSFVAKSSQTPKGLLLA